MLESNFRKTTNDFGSKIAIISSVVTQSPIKCFQIRRNFQMFKIFFIKMLLGKLLTFDPHVLSNV